MIKKIKNDYALWVCSLFFLLLAISLYLITSYFNWGIINNILNNIASVLIVSGIYSILYEYILKARLIDSIDEKINLKKGIAEAGLADIVLDIKSINYTELFKKAEKNIDIFHIYGRTWTSNNSETIKRLLKNKNLNIRIVLLDPNSKFVDGLADFYGKTTENLKTDMKSVLFEWKKLYDLTTGKNIKSKLKLYYHNCQPSYCIYRVDNVIISVSNKISKDRGQYLPSIICKDTEKDDNLFKIYLKELEEVIETSVEIDFKNLEDYFGGSNEQS